MTDNENALLQQIDTLTKERDTWAAKYHQANDAYDALMHQLQQLLRHRFGKKSERFEDPDNPQQRLFEAPSRSDNAQGGDDPHSDVGDNNVVSIAGYQRRKKARSVRFPDTLPRREVVIPVAEDLKRCDCGRAKIIINHAIHERLHYQPAIFEVIVEKREIAACPRRCKGQVITAARPPNILPKSKLAESLLAHIIVSKLDDRQPFYHLEKQFKHRANVTLSRQTMARSAIACAPPLQPIVNLMKDEAIGYGIAALDATGLQVLNEPRRSASVHSSVYCMRGGPPDRSVVLYDYNARAHKQFVDQWFAGFSGIVHCDADPLFDQLFARDDVHPSYCHAHARRKFEPIAKATQGQGLAHAAMQFYQRLYQVERYAKDQAMSPEQRLALRQQVATPIIDEFKQWLDQHYPTLTPKSSLGKAFTYVLSRWEDFCRYLREGRLEIDNNLTEQQIKPFVIARKNFLFANTVSGAKALCVHFSLIRTAKAHGLDPFHYYEAILKAAPRCQTISDYEALLPWRIELKQVNAPPLDQAA